MRLVWFIAVVLILLIAPLPWALIAVLLYALRYFAWELLIVAVCIDGYFGFGLWPQYTVLIGATILLLEWVAPQLFYTRGV